MNIVIRECSSCSYSGDDRKTFVYLRNGVWSCPECGSKYTFIKEVIKEKQND